MPATGAYSPGSWVTWQHPGTGHACTGIVTSCLPDNRTAGYGRYDRAVIPSDGSAPVVMELSVDAKPSEGSWRVVYGEGLSSPVEPGACIRVSWSAEAEGPGTAEHLAALPGVTVLELDLPAAHAEPGAAHPGSDGRSDRRHHRAEAVGRQAVRVLDLTP
jgi:hypothetical protein